MSRCLWTPAGLWDTHSLCIVVFAAASPFIRGAIAVDEADPSLICESLEMRGVEGRTTYLYSRLCWDMLDRRSCDRYSRRDKSRRIEGCNRR